MSLKRPPPQGNLSSSSSSSETRIKRLKRHPKMDNSNIKAHIIQAKLDPNEISDLFTMVENEGSKGDLNMRLCPDVREANLIITAVRMRRRLERHVDWGLAKEKAIVTPKWLHDSVKLGKPLPCGDYAALADLHDETAKNCPDSDDCGSGHEDSEPAPIPPRSISPSVESGPSVADSSLNGNLSHKSRYACARASPLVCKNQGLVAQLAVVRKSRELEGEDRSALSYERAIAVIKAYPNIVTPQNLYKDFALLPYIGDKILSMVEEYVTKGQITEAHTISQSTRFKSLSDFNSIYGIGPTTARKLYALGLRTLDHLDRYYEVNLAQDVPSLGYAPGEMQLVQQGPDVIISTGGEDQDVMSIKTALTLRHDFEQKMSRKEVEEIHRVIMHELRSLQNGCTSTIVGGQVRFFESSAHEQALYRRGKTESNDVDIVITHPDATKVNGLCKKLVNQLHQKDMVRQVMHLSGFHAHNALRTTHWDSLEKALTVFVLPSDDEVRIHRRVDLIFAVPEVYWTAITGWTGSKMFERDLRLWAKQKKGFKFDSSGITRRRDSKLYFPKSEREIFRLLGLEWVDPRFRNADA